MKWITRSHVHVDRVACPWLITRFIDSDAEFLNFSVLFADYFLARQISLVQTTCKVWPVSSRIKSRVTPIPKSSATNAGIAWGDKPGRLFSIRASLPPGISTAAAPMNVPPIKWRGQVCIRRHRSFKLPRCHADKSIPQNSARNKSRLIMTGFSMGSHSDCTCRFNAFV